MNLQLLQHLYFHSPRESTGLIRHVFTETNSNFSDGVAIQLSREFLNKYIKCND